MCILSKIFITCCFVLMGSYAVADSTHLFQNKWINDYGHVDITKCKDRKCHIEIDTINGIHTCELEGELTVLSKNAAVFQVKNLYMRKGRPRFSPVNLSLSGQVLTVTTPEESTEVTFEHCGSRGFFDGEYTNVNMPRIYKTSFNCDNARAKIDLAICHSKELAYADTVLSKLYLQLKTKQFEPIVRQQKEWIKERNLCLNESDLNQCVAKNYDDRILTLQQQVMSHGILFKNPHSIPYNFDYFIYRAKTSESWSYDVFLDPPLQSYLKSILSPKFVENILSTRFYELGLGYYDDSLIMITGGAPGLYTIYEGALILTKENQIWLAYINLNDQSKKQIVVLSSKNVNETAIPIPLKKWVEKLLPDMDYKEVKYKKIFPTMVS